MYRLFVLLLLLNSLCCPAQFQTEFARLGVNEGLSQNSVYAIHQDEQGFMWMGTGDGLNRYDGKECRMYRERFGDSSGKSLPGRVVSSAIIEDRCNRLWFNTDKGLVIFDKKNETFLLAKKGYPLQAALLEKAIPLGADLQNNIWLQQRNVLLRLNPTSGKLQQFAGPSNPAQAVIAGNEIFFLRQQTLYALQALTGLLVEKGKAPGVLLSKLSSKELIIQGGNAVIAYDTRTGAQRVLLDHHDPLPDLKAYYLQAEYPKGVFYLRKFRRGLLRYNQHTGEKEEFLHAAGNPASISNDIVITSFVDRTRNLWIGTEGGGVSRLDLKPAKFNSFPARTLNATQAANLMVKSICEASGRILIGSFDKGLFVSDASRHNFQQIRMPDVEEKTGPSSINVLQRDHRQRLWMNIGHAIGLLDTVSFRFRLKAYLPLTSSNDDGNYAVYSFAEYAPGKFLVGTNYGLYRFTEHTLQFSFVGHSAFATHIAALNQAPDGTWYAGTIRNGFVRFRMEADTLVVLEQGLAQTGIRHFYFDTAHRLVWMANENGLVAYNSRTQRYQVFGEDDGLSNSYIYSILPENDSCFWVSTNRGLNRVEVKALSPGHINTVHAWPFLQVDGLQSNEFNTGAYYKNGNGEFFFGGVNGINWFRPGQVATNRYQPAVVLTGFTINEKPWQGHLSPAYLQQVSLPYWQNTLRLRFASLEFTNADANLYLYKLEGFDKEWINSSSFNEARYANLNPGRYTFWVRGSNSDGLFSEARALLQLRIVPPYWQTTWFRVGLALLVLGSLAVAGNLYIRQRVRNQVKEMEKQKAVNEERLRISRDMHDELGTGLTKIALLSEVTQKVMQSVKEGNQPLLEIASTSRQLTQKMGEIIWTLNPVNDTLDNLAAYLKEQLYEICEVAGFQLCISYPEIIPQVQMTNMQRRQVFLTTKEGVNNIIKHAVATKVFFSMQVAKDAVEFALRDNGGGFSAEEKKSSVNGKRNGLQNMAWRMAQVGGQLTVTSEKGKGTTLCYRVPFC